MESALTCPTGSGSHQWNVSSKEHESCYGVPWLISKSDSSFGGACTATSCAVLAIEVSRATIDLLFSLLGAVTALCDVRKCSCWASPYYLARNSVGVEAVRLPATRAAAFLGCVVFTFPTNGGLVRVDCTNILSAISNVYFGTDVVAKGDDKLQKLV